MCPEQRPWRSQAGFSIVSLVVCLLIAAVGGGILYYIYQSEPTAERVSATRKAAAPVDVMRGQEGSFKPIITALGTVMPAREMILRPRISGEVVELSQEFVPGGFLSAGEVAVRLDPEDYENALEQRKSELARAKTELKIEMGRQDVAEAEYELLGEELSEENRALVLREPQLEAARARLEAARSAVDQAQAELERTKVRAPFDAQILSDQVDIGSQVSPGDRLAHLAGYRTYWVEVSVPMTRLRWLDFERNGSDEMVNSVEIRNRRAWGGDAIRTGRLYKLIGALEERSRMARVLVAVDDPLARQDRARDLPRLMIGAYVEARIQGREIPSAVKVDRGLIRANDTAWVFVDGKLEIRDVEVAYEDADFAYVTKGLDGEDQIVVTDLTTVVEGTPLRIKDAESEND